MRRLSGRRKPRRPLPPPLPRFPSLIKSLTTAYFSPLMSLNVIKMGTKGGNINFKPRITRVPFSIVFHSACTACHCDNTTSLFRFQNLERNCLVKYLTVEEGKNRTRIVVQVNTLVVFYVIGSALYTIFVRISSASVVKNRFPTSSIKFLPEKT